MKKEINIQENDAKTEETASEEKFSAVTDGEESEDGINKKKKKPLDIFPRIVCVLLALIIWFYVMQVDREDYEEEFSAVEVVLTNTSILENERNLYVYSGYGFTVDVTVNGKKSVINKYSSDDISVTADLKDITEAGEYKIPISVTLPAGLSLAQTDFSDITVYVDEKKSETFKIKAKVSGANYSNEFEYGELTTEYDTVIVTGPKNVIDSIDYAIVDVDFSSLGIISETTSSVRTLGLVDKDGNTVSNPYLKLSRNEVKVTLPVYTEKEVPLSVSYMYGYFNEKNVEITITPETVRVKGDPAALSSLETLNVTQIDETAVTGDTTSVYTLADTDYYSVLGDRNVTVSIKHVGTLVKTYSVDTISVDAGSNTYELLTESVDVTLRGSAVALSNIEAGDISLKADISEYSKDYSGVIKADLKVSIRSNYGDGVYEVGSYTAQIKVN